MADISDVMVETNVKKKRVSPVAFSDLVALQ